MSEMATTAAHLHRSLEGVLSRGERLKISIQLGSGILAGGLLIVGMLVQWYGAPEQRILGEVFKALAATVVALPVFFEAIRGLLMGHSKSQIAQLVALATLAAMAIGDFYTATLVPLIMHIGHFLEERSVMGAQAAVEGLRSLQGRTAALRTAEGERQVEAAELRRGDVMIVRPGDVLAADGKILEGSSAIDQSSITGESTPEEATEESLVFAGAVNLTGSLTVEVTKAGSDTAIGRVVELLREAEQSKTAVLRLIEQYAGFFVLLVVAIAAVVLFVSRDVSRAIAVLVVGCPGPFILAGPTAMVAALAAASRHGILIKNSKFLESLGDINTVVLDKTGTVTLGELKLVELRSMNGTSEEEILQRAFTCARGSKHPVCRAITEAAEARRLEGEDGGTIEEISGKGVRHSNGATDIFLGRGQWLQELGCSLPAEPEHHGALAWLAVTSGEDEAVPQVLGCLLLADEARPEAKHAVLGLRELGIDRHILLTGDRARVAHAVGATLELDQVVAEVLPEQKLETVQEEKQAGNTVMVVGDGINDALALASGDVGVAMGGIGSDVALKSADVVLARNDLSRLPLAVELSRKTRRIIHQNVLIGAGIAMGMLLLAASGAISPLAGAILHNVGEIYVIGNSARLLRIQK